MESKTRPGGKQPTENFMNGSSVRESILSTFRRLSKGAFAIELNLLGSVACLHLRVSAPAMDPSTTSAVDAANEALASIRLSSEHTNGHSLSGHDDTLSSSPSSSVTEQPRPSNGRHKASGSQQSDQVSVLRAELERTRAEKDTLDEHYRTLLDKVTAMRATLGNKLKQDAVRILSFKC